MRPTRHYAAKDQQESLVLFPAVLFASLAFAQQTPASPQTPPPARIEAPAEAGSLPAVEVTGEARTPVTQVCRTEPVTGSRFGRRVCRSSAETADDRRDSQEMLRRMQGARMPDS
jgi:hypothetical protein